MSLAHSAGLGVADSVTKAPWAEGALAAEETARLARPAAAVTPAAVTRGRPVAVVRAYPVRAERVHPATAAKEVTSAAACQANLADSDWAAAANLVWARPAAEAKGEMV